MRNDLLPDPPDERPHVGQPGRVEDGAVMEAPGQPQVEHQGVRHRDDEARPERASELARRVVAPARRHRLVAVAAAALIGTVGPGPAGRQD